MGSVAERTVIPFGEFEVLREAREVIDEEARALLRVAAGLDEEFCKAVDLLCGCTGCVVVTGMGKAGLIGRKIAATLSSLGTRSHFLHPAEAAHGDLGCLATQDVLIVLSNSGETDEVCRLLPSVGRFGIPIIAITASRTSTLGRSAGASIELGRLREAGPHALAPSTTTTAMLAVGDALALVVGRRKGFTPQQFALYHSGGSLGARLKSVGEIMRTGAQLRIAAETKSIRDVFADSSRPGRRTGAVILIDTAGRLSGLFTDSDLARLLERRQDTLLDRPIAESMTRHPLTTTPEATLSEAVEILSQNRISELPVVDSDEHPLGILDVTDVVATGLLSAGSVSWTSAAFSSTTEEPWTAPA
ncbi:MAG TPA: KpsF/GutQ family sugar-phosphate isomerase [Planctomycetaceae bacterium]|jgi:arabinose-5-phosphate isomerase|nr:KpsF/GutQ family sugar-phosphate isomerase [Planctomycetaceae bacterium]